MVEETNNGAGFWKALIEATDPAAYQPERNDQIISQRLEGKENPYYVLKQPLHKTYLRLSEEDYALWWQMNGRQSIKKLLFYSLRRYQSLPIGRLNRMVDDLRTENFLADPPINMYQQVETELAARNPASRGRRLWNAFLSTEISVDGLDNAFNTLYRWLHFLYHPVFQAILLMIIVFGGLLFSWQFLQKNFYLISSGGAGIISLLLANLFVIAIHELAHGLTTKHFDRELNRGGFLLYWGMPAFFVDTRDTWLSSNRVRMFVSWAGPHSGLLLGGLTGFILTAATLFAPQYSTAFWAGFFYQIGFLAYLSVFLNLNPLLELDGYFILMDWLEMPGLRGRAFHFWRVEMPGKFSTHKNPRQLWNALNRQEQIFTFYGALAFVYSVYAFFFALYFWETRLVPFIYDLWTKYGVWGKGIVLLATAVIVIPTVYYLFHFAWHRLQTGLEWLARRDLLARPDVLAFLVGPPLLIGIPVLMVVFSTLPAAELWLVISNWLLHLAAIAAMIGIARQVPGSRFQWVLWSLVVTVVGVTLAWLFTNSLLIELNLILAAGGAFSAGMIARFTVWPHRLERWDKLLMIFWFLLGLFYGGGVYVVNDGRWLPSAIILTAIFSSLILMTPLLINFFRSRFALPWMLIVLAILAIPWLQFFAFLHLPAILLWLFAASLYLLIGALTQFARHDGQLEAVGAFDERERLVNSFNHFMQAMFASYETIFGGRRLSSIQMQMLALGPIDPDEDIFEIGQRCRTALLLAIDRLDDLAGTPYTRQAGQAAYDSLPWLEAETLARHVLADMTWGSQLAQGFIIARDRRAQLIRQADIFAGFDHEGVQELLAIVRPWECRAGLTIARGQTDAQHFYLIESGEIGVFHDGVQMASITGGGYFGTMALLDSGSYMATYRALSPVQAMVIDRERFDPLLRADTTLSRQVSSGARERQLLKQMPLFSSLSPQQLATIDARLQRQRVPKGEVIVRQGQPRSDLFIIAAGAVEVIHEDGAGEQVIGDLGSGEHFGEYALFADTTYTATYRAQLDTELLLLDEPKFDELVADCERMSHYVEQIGSGRLFATRRRAGLGVLS